MWQKLAQLGGGGGDIINGYFINGVAHPLSDFENPLTHDYSHRHNMFFGKIPSGFKTLTITAIKTSTQQSVNIPYNTSFGIYGINGESKTYSGGGTARLTLSLTEDIEYASLTTISDTTDRNLIITFS